MSACTEAGGPAPEVAPSNVADRPPAAGTNTALAFALAPGIAAAAGALLAPIVLASNGPWMGVASAFVLVVPLAVSGYAMALVIAVPIYLVLPESARSTFASVVPMAGCISAAPWMLIIPPGRGQPGLLLLPFALGCVAGAAFVLIRGERPGAADRAVGGGGS